MTRPKTGGRQKGTPNKSTQAIQDLINSKYPDYDPIMQMVEVANDKEQELSVRLKCAMEVAPYLHAKRKAVDLQTSINTLPEMTDIERAAKLAGILALAEERKKRAEQKEALTCQH